MSNVFSKFIIIFITLLFPLQALSVEECDENEKITNIYFGNGVNNSLAEARLNMRSLAYAYLVKNNIRNIYPNEKFGFFVAYNESRGFVRDILEVFNQKVDETGGLTVDEIFHLVKLSRSVALQTIKHLSNTTGAGRIVVDVAIRAVEIASDAYLDELSEDANGLSRYFQAETENNHVQKYNSDLLEGKRVIVFAHSQGNMFANYAVNTVIDRNQDYKSNIGVVGVATPANRTINNNVYYTAHDDRVIDALRVLYSVLPSNIDNDPGFFDDPRDFANHNFLLSYMASELTPEYALGNTLPSRAKINSAFLNLLSNLTYPEPEIGSGAIKITLEWGSQPDVDLHVNEPNGDHVYYRNKRGTSGFLDLDDTDGFGPEHYFVSCETLEEGIYRVGVNYFRGSAPETANVQVATGDGTTRPTSKTLTTAVGSSGNNSPIAVADIDVNLNAEGNYTYEVTLH